MAEWLILLVLVPAIVVPVVLLVGFAGCGFEGGVIATVLYSAVGKSASIITLTWTGASSAVEFEFERTKISDQTKYFFTVLPPTPVNNRLIIDDNNGLDPGTTYRYRGRAIFSDGDEGGWSHTVDGTTFSVTFEATLLNDEEGWEGYCLVQRIEAVRLSTSGTQVRLTLRASSVSDASIERIYISQPDPAGDPYDSAADLKEFYPKVVVKANTAVTLSDTLPNVNYTLDHGQPLLIAVDFSASPPSGIRYRDAVPPEEAVAYFKQAPNEAPKTDRTGYTRHPQDPLRGRICLIEKIEVG